MIITNEHTLPQVDDGPPQMCHLDLNKQMFKLLNEEQGNYLKAYEDLLLSDYF